MTRATNISMDVQVPSSPEIARAAVERSKRVPENILRGKYPIAKHWRRNWPMKIGGETMAAAARPVNAEKRRLIQRGAQDWLRRLGHPPIPIRFDIVEVVLAVLGLLQVLPLQLKRIQSLSVLEVLEELLELLELTLL